MVQQENVEELINELNVKVELTVNKQFTTYHILGNDYETELRIAFIGNTLIISRVLFRIKRKGIMTACYKILKSFCRKNNFDKIVVQSVLTKEMSAWCKKHKFVPSHYCLVGDYVKTL